MGNNERLAQLAALWNRVERRCKEVEQFRGEVLVPAINEMRYAGRRIADALALMTAEDAAAHQAGIDEHLVIAKNYLINADHDITDSICFVVIRLVDAVIRTHGREKIATHYPEFWNIYPTVLDTQKIIQGSREDRQQRIADYEKLANDYLPKLKKLYEVLTSTRELRLRETNEKLGAIQDRLDFVTILSIIGSLSSISAVVIAVVAWILPWSAVWTYFHPPH